MLDAISGASDGVGDGNDAAATFAGAKDDAIDCDASSTGTSTDAGDDSSRSGDVADDDEDDDDTSV